LPGEDSEFDWSEVKLNIGVEQKRIYIGAFTASGSNYQSGNLYSRHDTLAFMESHNDFIAHVGVVYHEIVRQHAGLGGRVFRAPREAADPSFNQSLRLVPFSMAVLQRT